MGLYTVLKPRLKGEEEEEKEEVNVYYSYQNKMYDKEILIVLLL